MKSVLIIEDEAIQALLLKSIIELSCYDAEVLIAQDIQVAEELIASQHFDLITFDLNLGRGETGLDLFRKMKKGEKLTDTTSFCITAYGNLVMTNGKDIESFILASGFDKYIDKIDLGKDEFFETLKEALK